MVHRGHNGGARFFDEQDRYAYLGRRRDALQRERCRLHAAALLTTLSTRRSPRRTRPRFRA
jgi:hypothetical protein